MKTRALEFWNFKDHPFKDYALGGDKLDQFVNRTEELDDLENALHNRITGVYGGLGIGKSSFLKRFAADPPWRKLPVAFVHLPADSVNWLYREILGEVLALHIEGKLKIKKWKGFDSKNELIRLEGTVAYRRLSTIGGKLGIIGELSEDRKKEINPHDEASARHLLSKVIKSVKDDFVIILDDFHNLAFDSDGNETTYFSILDSLIKTVDQFFNSDKVAFIITLDEKIDKLIKSAREKNRGEFAFSIGDFTRLDPLNPKDIYDMIEIRLSKNGWNEGVNHFISEDSFFALLLCSEGNPRRALRLIRNAMLYAAKEVKGQATPRIELTHMEKAAQKANEELDRVDLNILNYIAANGSTYASSKKLKEETGRTRTAIGPRLDKLQKRIRLKAESKEVNNTRQIHYSIPNFSEMDYSKLH
jgi:hypothetical protein